MKNKQDKDPTEIAAASLGASVLYFQKLHQHFRDDTLRAMRISRQAMQQMKDGEIDLIECEFHLRTLIRTFFAELDGVTYLMRRVVLWAHKRGELALSEEDLWVLSEGELGSSSRRRRFNTTAENLEHGYHFFGQIVGLNLSLDKQSEGWSTFQRALRVRQGVTHPEDLDSFFPSMDSLWDFQKSVVWFSETMSNLMKACLDAHRANRASEPTLASSRPGGVPLPER